MIIATDSFCRNVEHLSRKELRYIQYSYIEKLRKISSQASFAKFCALKDNLACIPSTLHDFLASVTALSHITETTSLEHSIFNPTATDIAIQINLGFSLTYRKQNVTTAY